MSWSACVSKHLGMSVLVCVLVCLCYHVCWFVFVCVLVCLRKFVSWFICISVCLGLYLCSKFRQWHRPLLF